MTAQDREVAASILQELRAQGLLTETTLARIEQRLSDGTMTPDDWVREVERDLLEAPARAD